MDRRIALATPSWKPCNNNKLVETLKGVNYDFFREGSYEE